MTERWATFWAPILILTLSFYLVQSSVISAQSLVRVPTTKKVVALTFDDGPSPIYTPKILHLLTQYHGHATFFVLGAEAKRFPQITRSVETQGSVLAIHGWRHLNLYRAGTKTLWHEAQRTYEFLKSLNLAPAKLYRPPYGNVSKPMVRLFEQHGYQVVLWSLDTRDWTRPGTSFIVSQVLNQVKPGSIILMHDGGGNRQQTVDALSTILKDLSQKGYQFVTIPALYRLRTPIPDKKLSSLPSGNANSP